MKSFYKNPFNDFSKMENAKEPTVRGEGTWIEFENLSQYMNYAFVFFNPKIFQFHQFIKHQQKIKTEGIDQ